MIERDWRRGNARAFMHVNHVSSSTVCASPRAAFLSDEHLVAMTIHEISHMICWSMLGSSEQWESDRCALLFLRVKLTYRGPLLLQHVSSSIARQILAGQPLLMDGCVDYP